MKPKGIRIWKEKQKDFIYRQFILRLEYYLLAKLCNKAFYQFGFLSQ